jgi:LuxR family maltose regulon positive regulatory protein
VPARYGPAWTGASLEGGNGGRGSCPASGCWSAWSSPRHPAGPTRRGHRPGGHGRGGLPTGRARRRPVTLTEGIALGRQLTYTQTLATGLATLAWIRQAAGDSAGALDAIEEAGRVAPSPTLASLINPVPAQRVRLLLSQGDLAAATRWTDDRGLGPDDQPSCPREPEHLVLARVLLAHDLPDQALGLLAWLHEPAAAQGRVGSVIEVRVLQARALQATGDQAGALAALAEALVLAAPEGWLRVFVGGGDPMAALLGKLAAAPAKEHATATRLPAAYMERLLAAFEHAGLPVLSPPRRGGVAVAGLVEPLSARELGLLR